MVRAARKVDKMSPVDSHAVEFRDLRAQLDSLLVEGPEEKSRPRKCETKMLYILRTVLQKTNGIRFQEKIQRLLMEWILPQRNPKESISAKAPQESEVFELAKRRLDYWHNFRCVDKKQKIGGISSTDSPRNKNAVSSPRNSSRQLKRLLAEGPRPLNSENHTLAELGKIGRAEKSKVMSRSNTLQNLPTPSVSSQKGRDHPRKSGPYGEHVLDAEYNAYTFHVRHKPAKELASRVVKVVDRNSRSSPQLMQVKLPAIAAKRLWFDTEVKLRDSEVLTHQMSVRNEKVDVSLWGLCHGNVQGFSFFQEQKEVKKTVVVDCPKKKETPEPFTCLDVKSTANLNHPEKYGTESYFAECSKSKTVPKMPFFLLENSSEVVLSELTNEQLDAVAASLTSSPPMNCIDLQFNACSDSTFNRFLQQVIGADSRRASRLLTLDFSNNKNISTLTITRLSSLLRDELISLEFLRLNDLQHFTESSLAEFCSSVLEQGQIRELGMANTRIGLINNSTDNIAKLVQKMTSLQKINLGYNHFNEAGCAALGKSLVTSELASLDLSGNAGYNVRSGNSKYHPILALLEVLRANRNLKNLALADTCLDYCCAFMLEFITSTPHSALETLDVSDNALGAEGVRCLIRALLRHDATLYWINLQRVRSACIPEGAAPYERNAPCRAYELNLSHPQHRALLVTLAERGEHQKQTLQSTFRNTTNGNAPIAPATLLAKKANMWCCSQTQGLITTEFGFNPTVQSKMDQMEVIEHLQGKGKIRINLTRFAVLMGMFRMVLTTAQRTIFFEAMSKDLILKPCHVRSLVKEAPELSSFIVRHLFHAIQHRGSFENIVRNVLKTKQQFHSMDVETRSLLHFNAYNPTDHYCIDLQNPSDFGLLERVAAVHEFELVCWKNEKLPDVSQHGNATAFRNVRWKQEDVPLTGIWTGPLVDILEFDYASVFKTSALASHLRQPMSDESYQELRSTLSNAKVPLVDQSKLLRRMSHRMILSPAQLCDLIQYFDCQSLTDRNALGAIVEDEEKDMTRSLLGFQYDNLRVDVFVMLFSRCSDHAGLIHKDCLYEQDKFTEEETWLIASRLGPIHTFDALNCSDASSNLNGNMYTFDLTKFENRVLVNFFLKLNATEGMMQEIQWSEQVQAEGVFYKIPPGWVDHVPQAGTLSFRYTHSGESAKEIHESERHRLATQLFGWPTA